MWNETLYQQAIKFAGEAHGDQKVPGGNRSYVVHLANVCMEVLSAMVREPDSKLDIDYAMLCALLHDTIEDTAITYDDIKVSFGRKVADGVLALTKNETLPTKREQMDDSLRRILEQPVEVRIVKMADRITNLQAPPHYWSREKCKKYQEEARRILHQLGGVHTYLEQRFEQAIEGYEQFV